MSEIPIGTPPAPPGRHAAPSGWYPDPARAGQERYWDGWQWSRNTREGQTPAAPPVPAGYGQPGARQQQSPYGQQHHGAQSYGPQSYGQQPLAYPGHGAAPAGGGSQQRVTADGVPLAGWWYRVLAVVVDSVIVGVLAVLVGLRAFLILMQGFVAYFRESVRVAQQGVATPPDPNQFIDTGQSLLLSFCFVGVGFVYYLVWWRFRGASLGQLLLGLRVVPVDQGRSTARLPWGGTVLRSLLWTLPGLTTPLLVFQLVDVLFPLRHARRQSLHDLAAGTQVVKVR